MKRKFKVEASSYYNSNPTSQILKRGAIEYNGYYIVEDNAGDGYNVFDENFSLVDEGYGSLGGAKEFIEQLVENDPERIHCATEEDESGMYEADMANGIQDVEQQDITGSEATKVDSLLEALRQAVLKLFVENPRMGFPEDEAEEYFGVNQEDVAQEKDYFKVNIWAEVGYQGMEMISEVANPIIQEVDSDAYFDFECPGRMSAWVSYSKLNKNNIYSETVVNASTDIELVIKKNGKTLEKRTLNVSNCNPQTKYCKEAEEYVLDKYGRGKVQYEWSIKSLESVNTSEMFKEGDHVILDNGMTGVVRMDQTNWDEQLHVDIEGLDETKYPWPWTVQKLDVEREGIYSATGTSDGYWYFTRHGVQPGSIPKDADVLDMIDTPSGTYVKLDRVLNTKELNYYDLKEQVPPQDVTSAHTPDHGGAFDVEPEQFFTREELNEMGDEVCERLNSLFGSGFRITELYLDDEGQNNCTMEIESEETGETFFANTKIDLRWGRSPRTMMLKCVKVMTDKFEKTINQTSFELSSGVEASTDTDANVEVEGAVFHGNDIPGYDEWKTTPPEEKEYREADAQEEYIETHLDAVILMDEDGSWTYEDESCPWARNDGDKKGCWYSDEFPSIRIAEPVDVVEKVDELLVSLLPEDPGRYHIQGSVVLTFNLSGIEYDETFQGYSEDEGNIVDVDYYTDDAEVEFNAEKSSIEHFQWRMVGPGEAVEVQAQEDITAMKDVKYQIKHVMKDSSFDEICDYLYDQMQEGMLTEDEYYEMQGYAEECCNSRESTEINSADDIQSIGHWAVVEGPKRTVARGYDNWALLEKNGTGITPRYSLYDNEITSIEEAPQYTFQLSKLAPYDNAEYVWCRYRGGVASYYKETKPIYTEAYICDEERYEEVAEWQNEIIEKCLARLEMYNSKIKENIDKS